MTTFAHFDESIYEAWKRYKGLVWKVPNHGLPTWLEIQFFYNKLQPTTRMTMDAAAGGVLMSKDQDEAHTLLEEMASKNYQ